VADEEPIVLYAPRMRFVAGAVALTALAAFCVYLVLKTPTFGILDLASIAALVLSVLGMLRLIGRLRDRRPALVIDSDGLTDESGFGSVGRRNLVKYLGIVPVDPAALGRRAGWLARVTLVFNRLLLMPPIVINGKAVGVNIDLLAQMIGERHAAAEAERKGGGWKRTGDG
jgi:hypothetical protein